MKYDPSSLKTIIEIRLAIAILRAILAEDDALAALSDAGGSYEANTTVREFARPFLASLEDFLNGLWVITKDKQRRAAITAIRGSVRHSIAILKGDDAAKNDTRIGAAHALEMGWHILGLAIQAEISLLPRKKIT